MLNSKEGRRGQMDSMFSAKHSGAKRRERALLFMKNMWNQSNPNYPPAVRVASRARRPSRGTATQIERASLTLFITPYRFKPSYAIFYMRTLELMTCSLTVIHTRSAWMLGYAQAIKCINWTLTHIHTTQFVWGASDSKTPGWLDQYGKQEMIHRHCSSFTYSLKHTHCTYI